MLVELVMNAVPAGAETAADLFAGCGTFTFSLAEHLQVYAAEGAEDSLAALDAAARRSDRAGRVQAELRALARFPVLADELSGGAVVVDRKRVVKGKGVSVGVDLGGRRYIKKKQ